MTVQAVFFDMGGTIETYGWTPELRIKATPGIQKLLSDAGIHFDLTDKQLYEIISAGLDAYHQKSLQTMEELPSQRVWMEYIFADYPVDREKLAAIAEDLMLYIETRYYERAMRLEVPAVLEALQKMGFKIGIISNVNSYGQVPTNLKAYGIIHYFNPIVLSSEYGRRKPDPAIFHYAARLANVPAGACLYIGDRIVRDIDGAQRAGFGMSIQIRHNFEHGEDDTGATPDAVIDNMNELLDILRADLDRESVVAESGKVHALIFDAGDILYYRPERGVKFAAFIKELGLEISPDHIKKKKAIEYKAYRGEINHDGYREAIVRAYGVTQPEQVARGKQALIDDDNNVAFFEGVQETLIALKERGYLLAIVTDTANSISAKLNWFERGGFGHVWDSIISSMELGTRKPDPKIYRATLDQLGVDAAQTAFVGHKTTELEGAKAVGMNTIAFNYEEDAKADFFIEKFSDLLEVPIISVTGKILQK
jgi:putative hydrolase of the HAD superfamily